MRSSEAALASTDTSQQVKSLFLDHWKLDEYNALAALGNDRARGIWEAKLPPDFVRPSREDSGPLREQWIKVSGQI